MISKTTKTLIILFGLLIIFSLSAEAAAGPFGRGGRTPAPGRGIMGLKTFIALNLSDAQKKEFLVIIEAFEEYRDTVRGSLREARENLSKALQAETINEYQVRGALHRAASIREELFIRRVKMRAELKSILTPEQRELLKERKALRIGRMKDRFQTRRQKNSQP